MDGFVDYYQVLQVQHFAEKEVIQAAFKKLCYKYHPDRNSGDNAADIIKRLNIAYNILKNDSSRKKYDAQWANNNAKAQSDNLQSPLPTQRMTSKVAQNLVKLYFTHLLNKDYKKAYSLLSDCDKKNIPMRHFKKWQRAVTSNFHINNFQVIESSPIENFTANGCSPSKVECIKLLINEENLNTSQHDQYSYDRIVIYENHNWHIYLGYQDVVSLANGFEKKAS